jgi:hypothetical protein
MITQGYIMQKLYQKQDKTNGASLCLQCSCYSGANMRFIRGNISSKSKISNLCSKILIKENIAGFLCLCGLFFLHNLHEDMQGRLLLRR